MRRLRLLFVTDEMEVGGTQRQIVYLATHLDRERFEPAVVYFRNRSFLVDDLEKAGVPVHCVAKRGPIDPVFLWRLVAFLRRGQYDVVHCFSFTGELWGAVARLLAPGPALITSVRNVYDWYSRLQWWLKGWAARRSALVVANSRAGARHAEAMMGLPGGAIRVVYNGTAIDATPVAPAVREGVRAELGIPASATLALFVGRLVPQKNVSLLLRAAARLSKDHESLQLILAGDGPLRAELEALSASLGLGGRVRFLGSRDDARRLMQASDLVVLPSVREGLSNVILEAMAEGRAVVASDVGGSGELVEDGRTGLLFPTEREQELADRLGRLASDPVLRRGLGEAGRRRAEDSFSLRGMVNAMDSIYTTSAAAAVERRAL